MPALDLKLYTRTSLDSDETELPDDLLDVWQLEAMYRVRNALGISRDSAAFEVEVAVVALQQVYSYTDTFPNVSVQSIDAITTTHWALHPLPHEQAQRFWQWNRAETVGPDLLSEFTSPNSGTPTHFSVGPSQEHGSPALFLWPVPSEADTIVVRGQANVDIETLGVDAVMPDESYPLIGEYMIARGYEMQAQISLSAVKFNRFEAELDALRKRLSRPSGAAITTIGGAKFKGPQMVAGRLPFSWES